MGKSNCVVFITKAIVRIGNLNVPSNHQIITHRVKISTHAVLSDCIALNRSPEVIKQLFKMMCLCILTLYHLYFHSHLLYTQHGNILME